MPKHVEKSDLPSKVCAACGRDPRKAASNAAKHGVSSDEAKSVLYDEDVLVIPDPDHSKEEERFLIIGRKISLTWKK